jgi:hypothetical protein
MSNIPRARELLGEIEHMTDLLVIRRQVRRALSYMLREPPCRRVAGRPTLITPETKIEIRRLGRSGLTMHQIANRTGVYNMGRISEVLNGKR